MKKTLLLIFGILFFSALGYTAFYFGTQTSSPETVPVDENGNTLFPFGNTTNTGTGNGTNTTIQNPENQTGELPRIRKIGNAPVAGMYFSDNDQFLFVDKVKGNIYRGSTKEREIERLTITTIPALKYAVFIDDAHVIVQNKDEDDVIVSILGSFGDTLESELSTTFLPENIKEISPIENGFIYLQKKSTGASVIQSDIEGSAQVLLFESGISDWHMKAFSDTQVVLTSSPAFNEENYMYTLQQNGLLKLITKGLGMSTQISPKGEQIFVSETNLPDTIESSLISLEDTNPTVLNGIRTLADKCVWGNGTNSILYCAVPESIPTEAYPDAWYQGVVSFSDRIWKIDTVRGNADLIADFPKEIGQSLDATQLTVNDSGEYILFINKKDSTLWSVKIID